MKKLFFLIPLIGLGSYAAQAQDTKSKAKNAAVGVTVGVNLQKLVGTAYTAGGGSLEELRTKLQPKFKMGLTLDIPVDAELVLQPGVNFLAKGAEKEHSENSETKTNLFYIDLPLNLIYKPVTKSGTILVGMGPYAGFGIGGRVTTKTSGSEIVQDVEYRNTVSNFDQSWRKVYYKPVEFGANFLLGFELKNGIGLILNTQIGLSNINSKVSGKVKDGSKTRNVGYGFSVNYRFRRSNK